MKDWIVSFCQNFRFEADKTLNVDDFLFSQDQSIRTIGDIIDNKTVLEVLGRIFSKTLTNTSFFLQRLDIKDSETFPTLIERGDNYLNSMFFFLWFAKDNSCSISTTTGFNFKEDMVYQIFPHTSFFKADCSTSDTTYTQKDFDLVYKVFIKSSEISKDFQEAREILLENESGGFNAITYKVVYKNLNRIDRSMRFLKQARETNILPMKISYYVLTLECLFSSGNSSELQHRLAERIALYIGENQENRIEVYNDFTTYYDVRSRYMHGSDVGDYTESKLTEMSIKLDSLLRKIFVKIMLEDSGLFLSNSKDLKKFFISQLFKDKNVSNLSTS